jgi:hypothetical protein
MEVIYDIYHYLDIETFNNYLLCNKTIYQKAMEIDIIQFKYKPLVIKKYGNQLDNEFLPNNFANWKQYYEYLEKVLDNRNYTIHLISIEERKRNDIKVIENYINNNLELMNKIEDGDIIENVLESGYRSNGIYFAKRENEKIKILDQYYDFDDYGSINENFIAFENIAIDKYSDYQKFT